MSFYFVDLEGDLDKIIGHAQRARRDPAPRPNAAPPLRSGRTTAPDAKPVTVSRRCPGCNVEMAGKRPQATTCSARCRQRLSRDRRGLRPKPIGVVVFKPRRRRS